MAHFQIYNSPLNFRVVGKTQGQVRGNQTSFVFDRLVNIHECNRIINQMNHNYFSRGLRGTIQPTFILQNTGIRCVSDQIRISSNSIDLASQELLYENQMGHSRDIMDNPNLKDIRVMTVVFLETQQGGACGEKHCLYVCLKRKNLAHNYKDYEHFCRVFSINAKNVIIPVERLDEVAQHCRVQIKVSGDVAYETKDLGHNRVLYLKLLKGHYTIDDTHKMFKLQHLRETECPIVIYDKDDYGITYYGGEKADIWRMLPQYKELKFPPRPERPLKRPTIPVDGVRVSFLEMDAFKKEIKDTLGDVIYLKREKIDRYMPSIPYKCQVCGHQCHKRREFCPHLEAEQPFKPRYTLWEIYQEAVYQMNLMAYYTNTNKEAQAELPYGINPWKIGYLSEIVQFYYKYFLDKSQVKFEMQPVTNPKEVEFLEQSVIHPYIFSCPGEYPIAYCYDICGSYPSVISSDNFYVPILPGVFQTRTAQQFKCSYDNYMKKGSASPLAYGIYCVNISVPEGKQAPFFILNKKGDKYTSIDIMTAWDMGLEVNLIEQEDNFLSYGKTTRGINGKQCEIGKSLFKRYIDYMSILKGLGTQCYLFKYCLSALYGTLVQAKLRHPEVIQLDETGAFHGELFPNDIIVSMTGSECGDEIEVETRDLSDYYKYPLARMKPFIYSQQRANMYKLVFQKYGSQVIRCHTDGVMITQEVPEFVPSKELGAMRPDYKNNGSHIYTEVKIHNVSDWSGK